MTTRRHWATTFAFLWALAAGTHVVVLSRFASSAELSTVFAGLTLLSPTSFAILGSFVALRLFVMLLAPAAIVSASAWLLERWRPLGHLDRRSRHADDHVANDGKHVTRTERYFLD